MTPRMLMVGPYLLVRPLRTKNLRIYTVNEPDKEDTPLATLWAVTAPEFGIPEEWRIRCAECPEAPSPSRAESVSKAFYDRDKALRWLRMHRTARHPRLEVA